MGALTRIASLLVLVAAWQAAAPLLDARPAVQRYEQATWGPEAARDLAAPHGWLLGQ